MEKSSKEGKESKESSTTPSQETPSATSTVTPDWSGFQAYTPIPPHGFLAANPQAHPYMWGVQHLMPPHPYATPPHPYVAMYPHGGIYAHPSMPPGSYPYNPYAMPPQNGIPEASVNTNGNPEGESKPSEAKEKLPIKRSKGSLGSLNMITGKTKEPGKASGASTNGAYSKSAESASEGSSEGSEANSDNSGQRQDSDTSQNGSGAHSSQNGGTGTPHSMLNSLAVVPLSASGPSGGVPGPTTNLNIGLDYWGTGASPTVPVMQGNVPSVPVGGGMGTAVRDGAQSQLWIQDERELKRQRRKQSNRESARRSRMRKQAECDELAQRAEVLKDENASIREELNRIKSEYEQLLAQNKALKERLGEVVGGGQDDPRLSSRNEERTDNNDDRSQHSTTQAAEHVQ